MASEWKVLWCGGGFPSPSFLLVKRRKPKHSRNASQPPHRCLQARGQAGPRASFHPAGEPPYGGRPPSSRPPPCLWQHTSPSSSSRHGPARCRACHAPGWRWRRHVLWYEQPSHQMSSYFRNREFHVFRHHRFLTGSCVLPGLMGSVVTGMAMGTGSAVAHRAVDSMMGPRQVEHVHTNAPAAADAGEKSRGQVFGSRNCSTLSTS